MNEQQRAELERIRDVLYPATGLEDYDEEIIGRVLKDIKALLAQDAPPKQDVPEVRFGNMAEPKIGCVNHDCDKCKAVAPVPNGPYSAPIKELWPVAPKPWVGLTDEEKASLANSVDYEEYYLLVENVEAKLKELNT
jgi:hypothetical protein